MTGSLLHGADGSLVFGPASERLLYKSAPPLLLTPSASNFYGYDSEGGWSQASYDTALDGAAADLMSDTLLGAGAGGALVSAICGYAPYSAAAYGRFRIQRCRFLLTADQKSRISGAALRLKTQMFWLIGGRGLAGISSETKGFIGTSNTLLAALTTPASDFGGGGAAYAGTLAAPLWARSWNALNADQAAAGGVPGDGWSRAPDLAEVRYPLPPEAAEAFRQPDAGGSPDVHIWFATTMEHPPYLGDWEAYTWDPGGNYSGKSQTGWEIAGEVNSVRLELGQEHEP